MNLKESKTEAEDKIVKEKEKVKNEFDLNIEKIKEELEKIRADFHKEVDEVGDSALK